MLSTYSSTASPRISSADIEPATFQAATGGNGRIRFIRILPGLRAEELIAAGRLILGLCVLLAITGDVGEPGAGRSLSIDLLLAYSVLAAGIFAAINFLKQNLLRFRTVIHALDVGVLMALLALTGGATEGYFSTLFFPVVAGALRWRETGALKTGAVVLILFFALSIYNLLDGTLDINTWLVRTAALVATVLVLGHIRSLEKRYATQIATLANWPNVTMLQLADLAKALLDRSAAVFGAPAGILVVDEPEEPWVHVFRWKDGNLMRSRQHHLMSDVDSVAESGEDAYLLSRTNGKPVSVARTWRSPDMPGVPLTDWIFTEFNAQTVLVLPLRTGRVKAHLFILDPPRVTADDLPVARILARHVTDSLEQFRLTNELRSMTASEERVRLSRNLHDGVLQTLSGIAMNLATVRQQYDSAPRQAHEQLEGLEKLLLDEQRDLRFFTEELRIRSGAAIDGVMFPDALSALLQRLETVWSVSVDWNRMEAEHVPPELCSDVYQLVHEAIVNASRHGHATSMRLQIIATGQNLRINLRDNGAGFPFKGRYTLQQMIAEKRGPRSLRERVNELGGNLTIDSSASGAELDVVIPFGKVERWA